MESCLDSDSDSDTYLFLYIKWKLYNFNLIIISFNQDWIKSEPAFDEHQTSELKPLVHDGLAEGLNNVTDEKHSVTDNVKVEIDRSEELSYSGEMIDACPYYPK